MTSAAGLLAAPLWFTAAAAAVSGSAQKISVEVRGPVALVEVIRALPAEGHGAERLLDVALPEQAALVDVAVNDRGRWHTAEASAREAAARAYVDALGARGGAPAKEPYDDGTTLRLRVAADPAAPALVRYRFAVLPETTDGRRRIRFPGSPERTPVPADVTASIAGATDLEIAGVRARRARASTRSGWEISWAARPTRARVEASASWARVSPGETLAAISVEAHGTAPAPPPPSVLFLIDRSRSVGLPGLAAERDLAGRLLEALPPSTRFDALFFDRGVRRLFPMSRPATREAFSALDAEMVPDRLRNGTDLRGALREAGALLRREASAFAPRTWLVLVTDGALAEADDGSALEAALGAAPGVELQVATFVVRPADDDPAPAAATQALLRLAAARGGVLREVRANELGDALPPALAALARGGDVSDVRWTSGGAGEHAFAPHLAPGEGRAKLISSERPPSALAAWAGGARARMALLGPKADAAWLRALAGAPAAANDTRLYASDAIAVIVERPARTAPVVDVVKGSLDRIVVRNTLSLAYMPRARACYLNRTAATPAERDLSGRVRVAIDLTRGEVGSVVVQASTLNHAGVEACLRDGAFELDVPRTLRSDAPSTAVLNLVFRPRTPERRMTPEEAALSEQIDLVIEEQQRAEGRADEPPATDRSMIPTR